MFKFILLHNLDFYKFSTELNKKINLKIKRLQAEKLD